MEIALVMYLYFLSAVANCKQVNVQLEADKPFQRVPESHEASIYCCYRCSENPDVTWIMNIHTINGTTITRFVNVSENVKAEPMTETHGVKCHWLILKNVSLSDTALYQCFLTLSSPRISIYTHGTFLQIYSESRLYLYTAFSKTFSEPMQKTLNLSESVKNSIITAEGVLLLLCVLIPGTMLLCKSKRLNELERKKGREEENIYEGLNLDDCNSTYHQIQRSLVQGPYQDVANCGDNIQLEKP